MAEDFVRQVMRAVELSGAADGAARAAVYERARNAFHARMAEREAPAEWKARCFNDLVAAIETVERELAARERADRFTLTAEDILAADPPAPVAGRGGDAAPKTVKVGLFEVEEGSEAHRVLQAQAGQGPAPDTGAGPVPPGLPESAAAAGKGNLRDALETGLFLFALLGGFVMAGGVFLQLGEGFALDRMAAGAAVGLAFILALWLVQRLVGAEPDFSFSDTPAQLAAAVLVLSLGAGLLWQGARDAQEGSYRFLAAYSPIGLSDLPGLGGLFGGATASPDAIVYSRWETLEEPYEPGVLVMDDLQ